MKILSILITSFTISFFAMANNAPNPLEGRWDLTVQENGKDYPSWLEVNHSGYSTLVGSYVGVVGSARPISQVFFDNGSFHFTIPTQWEEKPGEVTIEGKLDGDKITGTVSNTSTGTKTTFTGVRAPELIKDKEPSWATPIKLFDGKNMDKWKALGDNQWKVENGLLVNPHKGSNIITTEKFSDFKLHIEFKLPAGSNSGIYLRGRYELQIADSKGKGPLKDELGAIYGFLSPSKQVAKAAGEWQVYDVTLIGRQITVVLNGQIVISNQTIPGPTGGALDSNEGEPGPIYLQGDHGPVEFRNIVITPAK